MVRYIDAHRHRFGVEPICRIVPIAPSTYYAHKARARDPGCRSARALRDAWRCREIQRVWQENFRVYGVRKVWCQLHREGIDVARCTVARLMKSLGLTGARRGRVRTTTRAGRVLQRPQDAVHRAFAASRPECPVGSRSDLCGDLAGLCLGRLCHRYLGTAYRWLVCRSTWVRIGPCRPWNRPGSPRSGRPVTDSSS